MDDFFFISEDDSVVGSADDLSPAVDDLVAFEEVLVDFVFPDVGAESCVGLRPAASERLVFELIEEGFSGDCSDEKKGPENPHL